MIIGGQAVLLYGEPRLTKDIDVTLGVDVDCLPRVLSVVDALQLSHLAEKIEEFVWATRVLPVREPSSGIRIDFIFSFSFFEQEALSRTKTVWIEDVPVQFVSLEDLIIHKIIAGRPRDGEDVRAILLKNPSYDQEYIAGWLKKFDAELGEDFSARFAGIHSRLDASR